MDCHVEVLVADVLEGIDMVLGRIAFLIACKVKAHDSPVAVCNGQLGDLKAQVRALVAHGTQNQAELHPRLLPALLKALEDRLDDIIHGKPAISVENRSETNLTVYDVLLVPVKDSLIGNTSQGLLSLHHSCRDGKCLKVQRQALELAALLEPVCELGRILGRNGDIIFPGQINHCRWSEASVKMIVKLHLRNSLDYVVWNHCSLRHFPFYQS